MTLSSVDIPKQLATMKQMLAEDKTIPESFNLDSAVESVFKRRKKVLSLFVKVVG